MTEIIAKVINEKSLKTNSTLIHWINREFKPENIDELNALLIWKLLRSKDMQNFKPSAWSKGLEILHNWMTSILKDFKTENIDIVPKESKRERLSKSMIRKPSKTVVKQIVIP